VDETSRVYWNPYSKKFEPVLTAEQLENMWPYVKPKMTKEDKLREIQQRIRTLSLEVKELSEEYERIKNDVL
jgi:hypothetical protein